MYSDCSAGVSSATKGTKAAAATEDVFPCFWPSTQLHLLLHPATTLHTSRLPPRAGVSDPVCSVCVRMSDWGGGGGGVKKKGGGGGGHMQRPLCQSNSVWQKGEEEIR
jgi:hypothetical protein